MHNPPTAPSAAAAALLCEHSPIPIELAPRSARNAGTENTRTLFQAVWESSADGMRLTDADACIVAVNPSFCKLARLFSEELLGRPLTTIYSQEDSERMLQKYRQRFQARQLEKELERTVVLHDGRIVDLAVTNSFVELSGQEPLLLSVFRNVTQSKTAERALYKSEAKMRLIWENALDGMRLMDEHGTILMVNRAYCQLVERPRAALEGQPLSVVYESSRANHVLRAHQERFQSRTIPPHLQKEFTLWNGKRLVLELSNSFLEIADQPRLLLTSFRDITEGVRAQSRLRRLEQEFALERERERSARDNEMREAIGIARKVGEYLHNLPRAKPTLESLSKREREVLRCLVQGFLYKEIAARLSISIDTVRKHLHSIYRKLQVHSRTDAVVKYLQIGPSKSDK
jgi:PAS domain S-box-containing protein